MTVPRAHGPDIATTPAAGLLAVIPALILAACLGGCTPKRVTHHDEFSPAPTTTAGQAGGEGELPTPSPRGRSGQDAPVGATADGVQLGLEAATLARAQLGKSYQWGASGPDKFDCSGLVCHVYGSLGVPMPRVSRDQARAGDEVSRSRLQPGDLVFFATEGKSINHVGIYIGHNDFVHAPRRHVPVRTDSLNDSYWSRAYRTARRVS
ncbi:NlpC/P60 family protein 2 [bacterium]|nr:MAG: NlpC/P60 family protein 2 [bacterium]